MLPIQARRPAVRVRKVVARRVAERRETVELALLLAAERLPTSMYAVAVSLEAIPAATNVRGNWVRDLCMFNSSLGCCREASWQLVHSLRSRWGAIITATARAGGMAGAAVRVRFRLQ